MPFFGRFRAVFFHQASSPHVFLVVSPFFRASPIRHRRRSPTYAASNKSRHYYAIMTVLEKTSTSTTFVDLASAVEDESIVTIRLTDVEIAGDDDDAFRLSRSLRGHPNLEEVSLTNITLKQEGMKLDAMIEMLLVSSQNLKTLKLDNVPVQAKSVATLAYCETLTTLALPNNSFNDVDAKAIADSVEASNSVTTVDLSGNKISDIGCKSLGQCLDKNKVIEKISLAGNSISGAESNKLESTLQARAAVAA